MSNRQWIDSLKQGDQVAIYHDKGRKYFKRLDTIEFIWSKEQGGQIVVKGQPGFGTENFGRSGKRSSTDMHYRESWLSPITDVELNIVRSRELIEQLRNKDFAGLSPKQLEAIAMIIESGKGDFRSTIWNQAVEHCATSVEHMATCVYSLEVLQRIAKGLRQCPGPDCPKEHEYSQFRIKAQSAEQRGRELENQRIDNLVNDLICNLPEPKVLESSRLNNAYKLGQKEALLTAIEKIREKE